MLHTRQAQLWALMGACQASDSWHHTACVLSALHFAHAPASVDDEKNKQEL